MAYPEKLLAEDEKIVEHLHPHWITLVKPVGMLLLISALFGVGAALIPDGKAQGTLRLVMLAVALLLIVWVTVWPALGWRTTHYVFTTHRVMIRRGILSHVGRDIPLVRITDVAYQQTLLDRIVKAGTITIASASEYGQEVLQNIPQADRTQQMLNRLVEEDAHRRAGFGQMPQGGGYPGQEGQTGHLPTSGYPSQQGGYPQQTGYLPPPSDAGQGQGQGWGGQGSA